MSRQLLVMRSADVSDDGLYRYRLGRTWDTQEPRMVWIMLNPSTADAEVDDPTIRRCMGFARREGCGGIEVLNLYGLRATQPRELLGHPDPEGPDNLHSWMKVLLAHKGPTVAAWGARWAVAHRVPVPSVSRMHWESRNTWQCLGRTANGSPRHPLYVRADQPLEPW